jgi:hypothetical protein
VKQEMYREGSVNSHSYKYRSDLKAQPKIKYIIK